MREAATGTGASILQPYLQPILALLFENCESEEEGTRNVVAECLGKLALICPEQLVPLLKVCYYYHFDDLLHLFIIFCRRE